MTELPFAVPVRAIRVYPQESVNWICLRLELYGVYLSGSVCDSSGPELPLTKLCTGDRNCGANADCQKPNSNSGIRKTSKLDFLSSGINSNYPRVLTGATKPKKVMEFCLLAFQAWNVIEFCVELWKVVEN